MSILIGLGLVSLPPLIRDHITSHFGRLMIAPDPQALQREQLRTDGFVEGLAAARAVTPATIEALYLAIDHIAAYRLKELAR